MGPQPKKEPLGSIRKRLVALYEMPPEVADLLTEPPHALRVQLETSRM